MSLCYGTQYIKINTILNKSAASLYEKLVNLRNIPVNVQINDRYNCNSKPNPTQNSSNTVLNLKY
jgi:hypothetical protein